VQAVTITKTQGTKMGGEPTIIGMVELKRCRYCYQVNTTCDKLTTLFEPCHVGRYPSHFQC